jgi:hypothetical protein
MKKNNISFIRKANSSKKVKIAPLFAYTAQALATRPVSAAIRFN